MKRLAILVLAAGASLIPAAASAQVSIRTPGAHVVTHPGVGHHGFGGHFPRFNRSQFFGGGGFVVGGFFFQPQFHVQNWQLYGFANPGQHRWIRYHDDALLIDRGGRVHDFRERVQWDRYGERWDRDGRGLPHYVGRGGHHGSRYDHDDYDRSERYEQRGGWDYSDYGRGEEYEEYDRRDSYEEREEYGHADDYERRERYDDRGRYVPQPGPAYGGGGYSSGSYSSGGYGAGGYGGGGYIMAPVVITETTVTSPSVSTVVTEEVTEEVVYEQRAVRRAAPRRARAARPCNCPPPRHATPRHPPGERG